MEQLEEPSTAELLERIVQLEKQATSFRQHQAACFKQHQLDIEYLKAELLDLGKAFRSHVTHTSDDFKYLCQHIADIHDRLVPLVHKLFPESAKTYRQIDEILEGGSKSRGEKGSS